MQMGMVGLGRMGASMVRRLLHGGHECVVHDINAAAIASSVKEGAIGAASLDDFVARLNKPRVAWMMLPAAIVEQTVEELSHRFEPGDIIVDGGNSHYVDHHSWGWGGDFVWILLVIWILWFGAGFWHR